MQLGINIAIIPEGEKSQTIQVNSPFQITGIDVSLEEKTIFIEGPRGSILMTMTDYEMIRAQVEMARGEP